MPPSTTDTAGIGLERTSGDSRTFRTARVAASAYFLADGMIFGTWATLIPSFKSKFGLNEADIGVVLLGMVFGAILSMPIAGKTISRYGSRANLNILAPGFCVALALLALAPGFITLVAAAALFGAFKGAFDVTINSQGIAIENKGTRPIIAGFQALWSLGGLFAALAVGLALKAGLTPPVIAAGVAATLLAVILFFSPRLLGGDAAPAKPGQGFKFPSGKMLKIGLLAGMALFAEGVMMDWSAVYSREVSGAAPWLAPIAYGVFSSCMAGGRLAGDWLIGRFGPSAILRAGGILTTAGLAIIIGIQVWPATFAGLALAGLGIANLVPIFFSAGGRAHEGGVGKGVALVSMLGYFGFLAGPPLIGGISHLVGLPAAFSVVVLLAGFIALFGNRLLGSSIATSRA